MHHLSGNTYAIPGDDELFQPWVGVIVTSQGTALIDSGTGPVHARAIQAALDELGAPPISHILLTHHHWDHVFGSAYFPGAHIVAHEQTQTHLQVMAEEPWSDAYVQTKIETTTEGGERYLAIMRAAVPDWTGFHVLPAQETFVDQYELKLGDNRLVMEHVGGQHEPDQCLVHIWPDNVLFLGDATYGRGSTRHWDAAALASDLQGFLARGADYYVEGHRPPATPERLQATIRRWQRVAESKTAR